MKYSTKFAFVTRLTPKYITCTHIGKVWKTLRDRNTPTDRQEKDFAIECLHSWMYHRNTLMMNPKFKVIWAFINQKSTAWIFTDITSDTSQDDEGFYG